MDEQTLKRARMRALKEDTSVNAVLQNYLETYAGVSREQREALERIIESSRESTFGSRLGGRRWTREELYDREGLRE